MPQTKQTAKKTTSLPGERVDTNSVVPLQSRPKPSTRSTRSSGLKVPRSAQLEATKVTEEQPSDKLLVNVGEAGRQENNVSQ